MRLSVVPGATAATSAALIFALCALILAACSSDDDRSASGGDTGAFCTPESLMEMVPALRNTDGQFEVPDPTEDLTAFYAAHQAVTRAIETALAQATAELTPEQAAEQTHRPLMFGPDWRSAEVGLAARGKEIDFEEDGGKRLASFGGKSFLSGVQPIDGTADSFYEILSPDKDISSLVATQATNLPCVNRILLAEASSGGLWMPPSYALGPEGQDAFFILDLCLENVAVEGDTVKPGASLFIAFQWADIPEFAHMQTDQRSLMHQSN